MVGRTVLGSAVIILFILAFAGLSDGAQPKDSEGNVEACFSGGNCLDLMAKEIAKARTRIRVQGFAFTSKVVTDALLRAHQRGVRVEVILDKSERQEGLTPGVTLSMAGVPVYYDGNHGAARSHVIIVDGLTVLTGSFSFTQSAEEIDAADLVIIRSKRAAEAYDANWQVHRQHSRP